MDKAIKNEIIFWLGIEDFPTRTKTEIYKDTSSDKFYMESFKNNIQTIFNKEFNTEHDCHLFHESLTSPT